MPITNDYGNTVVVCNSWTKGISHARWGNHTSTTLCGVWAYSENKGERDLPLERVECKRCLRIIERLKKEGRCYQL
jgi:hypothetical protein